MSKNIAGDLELIKRGTAEIIREEELIAKLKEKKPLIVKVGFDPTAPDIHLGHTVLLRKLRHFQELRHKVVFLIGDATALVGDPSGQSRTRPTLTWSEVGKNARTYEKQVGRILNIKDRKIFERRHNSEWFSRPGGEEKGFSRFGFETFVELAQRYTVARLLERDDFEKRLKENKPISFLELFYPLMQGYDSVKLKADIEIGGTDQKFNMLVGRNLQPSYDQKRQVVITMPILEGTDGVQKMSKTYGNYIGIEENPSEMFGKLMSISDDLMMKYFELLTDIPLSDAKKMHPRDAKKRLAKDLVSQYHSKRQAEGAEQEFERIFKERKTPENLPLEEIRQKVLPISLYQLLSSGLEVGVSKTEFRRLVAQGAVTINDEKVSDIDFSLAGGREYLIRLGKRKFVRFILKKV